MLLDPISAAKARAEEEAAERRARKADTQLIAEAIREARARTDAEKQRTEQKLPTRQEVDAKRARHRQQTKAPKDNS